MVTRIRHLAVLPVSMLPFLAFLFVTHGFHVYGNGVRDHGGTKPWQAPAITLSAADVKYAPPPAYTGQIPVLLYHGINYVNSDPWAMTPAQFATELAFLQHLGYHTISIYQYIAWREGKHPQLPSRPILLTFDDGRFDTYRGADQILAKYHMQATIYVIVGQVVKNPENPYYLNWDELKKMQASGRWDIQFHAYEGHVLVPKDAQGESLVRPDTPGVCGVTVTGVTEKHCGPFYSTREWLPAKGRIETMAEYSARVENDLTTGLKILRQHGFGDLKTMAMPFGEYGQTTNVNGEYDLAVERQLATIMPQYFVSIFIQSGHAYTPYSLPVEREMRFEPHARPGAGSDAVITTLPVLYHYLYHGDPTVIQDMKGICGPRFEITIYQGASCLKH
jgi:peptidoglycan/xylan/chitin deacetylase (PgdA/CDA1 family)